MPDPVTRLTVRVQPRASRDRLRIDPSGRIVVHITAPPVDGAANRAVCDLLAGALGMRKSSIRVEKGERSRDKIVTVSGISPEAVEQRLQSLGKSVS